MRPHRGPRSRPLLVAVTRLALALTVAVALAPTPALAQTVTWTGAVDSRWSNGSNWSTGMPPTTGDDVKLTPGAFQPSTYDLGSALGANPLFHSITLNPSGTAYGISPAVSATDVIALQSGGSITDSNNLAGGDLITTGLVNESGAELPLIRTAG
jgi:subtilase-type serine protease